MILTLEKFSTSPDVMDVHIERARRQQARAQQLVNANPAISFVTAFIMAGDLLSADEMTEAVAAGRIKPADALHRIGSYARFKWAVKHLPEKALSRQLLTLWSGADPDDTDLSYLDLFRRRAAKESRGYAADGLLLPHAKTKFVVYRGQLSTDPYGFSWTLDRATAVKFANGAGHRTATPNGTIFQLEVSREHILAYITGRGESEVIVDIVAAGLRGQN